MGPAPGVALGLSGVKLAIAVGCSVVLGALMMLGIGYYAPCMIMISLLGWIPKVSYPIMMGACAFLIPAGSTQFVRKETLRPQDGDWSADRRPRRGVARGILVKELPLYLRPLARAGGGALHGDVDAATRRSAEQAMAVARPRKWRSA